MSSGSYLTLSVYEHYYANSVLNRNNVGTYCASLHSNLQDLSNGFAFLSLIKHSIFITTDKFKLLNRANEVALGSLASGLLKLKKSQTRLKRLFNAAEIV